VIMFNNDVLTRFDLFSPLPSVYGKYATRAHKKMRFNKHYQEDGICKSPNSS
jgi:hypothetical protein